jgi:putative addiction module killer protein
MVVIEKTRDFEEWLERLRDRRAKARILTRIDRLSLGNPGQIDPVGDGVSEMKIHFGPGYRLYFITLGDTWLLLCGGDKSSQDRDIRRAKELASEWKDQR